MCRNRYETKDSRIKILKGIAYGQLLITAAEPEQQYLRTAGAALSAAEEP